MKITAAMVKELREATGLGMMTCKKALTEAEGQMELAIDNLRKKGQATAAKRAGKSATEGAVAVVSEGNATAIYEVNCETDFVANGDDFVNFLTNAGSALIAAKPANEEEALTAPMGETTLGEVATELMGKIGEKVSLTTYKLLTTEANEAVYAYVHSNKKVGAIVKLAAEDAAALTTDAVVALGKDIAMQVAASKPEAVNRDGIDEAVVAKEKEIFMEQIKNEGKPEAIAEKIAIGKLNKFFKSVVLVEQESIKEDKKSIEQVIEAIAKTAGTTISVVEFALIELGANSPEATDED